MSRAVRLYRLNKAKTAFFLCDIQEKFRPAIPLFNGLVQNVAKLLSAAKIVGLPVFVTEQYPEKLGKTVKELSTEDVCLVQSKTMFTMMGEEVKQKLIEVFGGKPETVVLFGIEAHICIEQTAMDLINNDIDVWLAADCVASRLNQDRDLALERLRDIGCLITTSESIIFNLLCSKDSLLFKNLSELVKQTSADMQIWR